MVLSGHNELNIQQRPKDVGYKIPFSIAIFQEKPAIPLCPFFEIVCSMTNQNNAAKEFPNRNQSFQRPPWWLLATVTWFGSGLAPRAPGTFGTIAALPFAAILVWAVGEQWAHLALGLATLIVFFLGWWASAAYVIHTGHQDPGLVVIDEVAGMWLTLMVAPTNPWSYVLGFIAFRIFDILKPWPVCLADRSIHGGLGIMLDDILAAGYAALALWLSLQAVSLL
jgi:phosphatidylglycerophosphatase A